jgi:hypothetical protein
VEGDENGDEKENFDENDEKENVDENGDENVDENGDEKENGDESPSFYVADDEKSIAIVDLLLESRDKT